MSSPAPLRQMMAMGVEPRVEVSVESFLAVPSLVAGTDRVAFMQEKLTEYLRGRVAIRVVPSPLPIIEHPVTFYWDAGATNDPGHRWFRGVLERAAATLA